MFRKPNGKFEFLSCKGQLSEAPQLEVGQSLTSKCDFDSEPTVVGYKVDKDVFYCCEKHRLMVEAGRANK